MAIITMLTTATALIVAGLGIILADSILCLGYLRRDLATLARILAADSTAAVAFDDHPDTANQLLAALRARPHVDEVCIYRSDGTMFARYSRDGTCECPPPGSEEFTNSDLK